MNQPPSLIVSGILGSMSDKSKDIYMHNALARHSVDAFTVSHFMPEMGLEIICELSCLIEEQRQIIEKLKTS